MPAKKRKVAKSNLKTKSKKSKAAPKVKKGSATSKLKSVSTAKISTPKKPYTKGEFLTTLSEHTGIARKEINVLLDKMGDIIKAHVGTSGPGTFTLPGLVKIVVIKKPATKARKGINPFTGEETMFKAKPARKVAKVRALKKLKEMV